MEKFIPYEKLSKKEKKKRDQLRRATWGALDPRTKRPDNPRAYKRHKARRWKPEDFRERAFCYGF